MKNEKKANNNNNNFFTFTFLYRNISILFENIFGKTWFVLLHRILRPRILDNRLGILTKILTVMDYYFFFFLYFRKVPSM